MYSGSSFPMGPSRLIPLILCNRLRIFLQNLLIKQSLSIFKRSYVDGRSIIYEGLWEYTISTWESIQYVGSVRIHDTYVREYSIRTDFSVRITRYDTQCVRIFPRELHKTIHSTYGFPRTNYTIQYIVCTEVSIVPEGSRTNYMIRTDSKEAMWMVEVSFTRDCENTR